MAESLRKSVEESEKDMTKVTTTEEGTAAEIRNNLAKQEKNLRWKLDLYILPWVTLLYLFCYIDRSNIGNARIAGLEKDLGMTGYDYNIVLSVFFVSYIIFELPGNSLCKLMGPGYFIPACTIGFGAVSIATAYVHTFQQLCGVRLVLGVFEAAMMPANILYLSRFYTRAELVWRICFFILSASLAGAFGGLLASGILSLDSFAGVTRWRMIFLIEGIVTVILGFAALIALVDRPESARFLTEDQKQLCLDRVKAERIGATEVVDKFNKKRFLMGMLTPVGIATNFTFLFNNITVAGLAFFLPTIVRTIYPKETVVQQQLHTVPPYVLGSATCLAICYASWKLDRRNIFITCGALPAVVGYIIFLASDKPSVRYGACFLPVIGIFANGAVPSAQVSASVVSDTARLTAVSTYAMMGNIGGLISTWAFLPFDGPLFHIGNGLNLAAQSMVFFIGLAIFWWAKRDNANRDRRDSDAELAGLTTTQIQDLDWKHPGFRWKL